MALWKEVAALRNVDMAGTQGTPDAQPRTWIKVNFQQTRKGVAVKRIKTADRSDTGKALHSEGAPGENS